MARGKAPAVAGPQDFAERFSVSRETTHALELYEALLRGWQKTQNLVAAASLDAVWNRHFADSAQLLQYAPEARRWLDLGSGAGFPGMVIAILLKGRAGAMVDLVESNVRKCAFLNAVRRETGAPARVHALRIEDAASTLKGHFDVVTARALAPLAELAPLIAPFLTGSARALLLKGRAVESELTEAARGWNIGYDAFESLTDPQGRILMVHKLQRR